MEVRMRENASNERKILYLCVLLVVNMEHLHHRHGQARRLTSLNYTYYIAIGLNLAFVILEAVIGLSYNSLGLLSDAGHKLLDVFSLLIALVAFKLTASRATKRYTYGFRKTSVLISLFNSLVLMAAVCVIIAESIEKLGNPGEVSGAAISWTAGAGILVSGVSALLLMRHQKGDINTRGAFLHMATDALVSFGVVVSGIIISVSGWNFIDPVISMAVAAVILVNTLRLLVESFRMSVDAVPAGIDYDNVCGLLASAPGVLEVEELHIWPVSIFDTALTAHVRLAAGVSGAAVLPELHRRLEEAGIGTATIECIEYLTTSKE